MRGRPSAPGPVGTSTRSLFFLVGVLLTTLRCSSVHGNSNGADQWKISYRNETEDLSSRWVADKYRDKLVPEQLRILIESKKGTCFYLTKDK